MLEYLKRLWFCRIRKEHKWQEINRVMLKDLSGEVAIMRCCRCGEIKKVYNPPPQHVNCRCYYDGL